MDGRIGAASGIGPRLSPTEEFMSLEAETQEILDYLRANESVRSLIKAARNNTLLYSGGFFESIFKELEMDKRKNANLATLQTLSDVLELVPAPPRYADRTLKRYVEGLLMRVPERPDGFAIWSALSTIFAGNAEGRVYFSVGSGVGRADKIFATGEIEALLNNPRIDDVTRELVHYFYDQIQKGEFDINVGLVPAPPDDC
jgi:hypothetical protein